MPLGSNASAPGETKDPQRGGGGPLAAAAAAAAVPEAAAAAVGGGGGVGLDSFLQAGPPPSHDWWHALAGHCAAAGCGVGARREGEHERRGSGSGGDARLVVLEASAASAAVLYRDYKVCAADEACGRSTQGGRACAAGMRGRRACVGEHVHTHALLTHALDHAPSHVDVH